MALIRAGEAHRRPSVRSPAPLNLGLEFSESERARCVHPAAGCYPLTLSAERKSGEPASLFSLHLQPEANFFPTLKCNTVLCLFLDGACSPSSLRPNRSF